MTIYRRQTSGPELILLRADKGQGEFNETSRENVLMPLERGGKAGLFGRAGVGKTVLLSEMIHNTVKHHEGVSILSGNWYRLRAAECLEFALTITTNAMFGIETPLGRTPFQGGSLDITSPRAEAPGLFC